MTARQLASRLALSLLVMFWLGSSLEAQNNPDKPAPSEPKAIILKHLAVSRDFTLKVADQMPAAEYAFKLTPQQMSFAEQMVHIAETFDEFVSPLSDKKLDLGKPESMNKPDVMAFVKRSFDAAMEKVVPLSPEQLMKSYTTYGVTATGLELLLELLDHTTQHRASAEMYLRVKGITPAPYQF